MVGLVKATKRLAAQFDTRAAEPSKAPIRVFPSRMDTWAQDVLLTLRKNRRAWQNPTNGSQ